MSNVRNLVGVQCISYTRVSTWQQAAEDKTSLADQSQAIEKKAAAMGLAIGESFTDSGISGSTVENRPGLVSLIASCEAAPRTNGTLGYVLVLNESRWGRFDDVRTATYWRLHLARFGWEVRFVDGDSGLEGVGRELERTFAAEAARQYRQHIVENTIRGSRSATIQGFWKGAAPPLGYVRKVCYPVGREQRILPDGVRKAADERVMLWPEETVDAPFVRRLFETYASGEVGLMGLAELAYAERPDRSWDSGSLYFILTNRVYLGELNSKHAQTPEPYGNPSAHPAIVSVQLFNDVAARLKANRRVRRGGRRTYMVTRMVLCGTCGLPLVGSGGSAGKGFYRCTGAKKVGTPCSGRGRGSLVQANRLEDAIVRTLAAEFRRDTARAAVRAAIDAWLDAEEVSPAVTTDAIDSTIATIEKRIQRLVAAVANDVMKDEEARALIDENRSKLVAAQRQRADVVKLAAHRVPVDRQRLYRLVDDMPALLGSLTGLEAREAIEPWLASAIFDRDTRQLTMEIRRVPAFGGLSIAGPARPARAIDNLSVSRSVSLQPDRAAAGRKGGLARAARSR